MVCFVHFDLEMCFVRATTACTFSTSQLPKVVRSWCALYILTWKCAWRHNGVHFFDISTSCFVHFDLEICFGPQRRTLFRHLNFQKWSKHGVFCNVLYILTWKCAWRHNGVHFLDISTSKSGPNMVCFVHVDLEMCFVRATTACTFSTSQLPKVVRTWCVLYILTWKCASFAPQRRALFGHLNFQKWSEHGVFCTF